MDLVLDDARGRVVVRQENGEIIAWAIGTGKRTRLGRTSELFAYCPETAQMVIGGGGHAQLFDAENVTRRPIATGGFFHAAWAGNCTRFALAGDDRTPIGVWRADGIGPTAITRAESPVRNALALSGTGRFVAAGQGTYSDITGHLTAIEVLTVRDGSLLRTRRLEEKGTILGMWALVFAPDSDTLLIGTQTNERSGLRAVDPETGRTLWRHDGFEAYWVRAFAASPDGTVFATGDEKGRLRVWDVATGARITERQTGLVIQSLDFSSAGDLLAVGLWDGTIGLASVTALTER